MSEEKNIQSFSACSQHNTPFPETGNEQRRADERIDFIYPAVLFPSNRILAVMGEAGIRNMVHYHHTLLRKSSLGALFSDDDAVFEAGTVKTADFFVEVLGGEKRFTEQYGHPALRQRHFRFLIDEQAREIWLLLYKKTLKDIQFPKDYLEEFWNWIEPLSIRMINRRTTMTEPRRFFWADVKGEFGL